MSIVSSTERRTAPQNVYVPPPPAGQITSEGYVFMPSLSADGKKLYYLVRSYGLRSWNQGGLWVADLETGQRQRLFADVRMIHYSVAADGQRVVFVSVDEQGRNPV